MGNQLFMRFCRLMLAIALPVLLADSTLAAVTFDWATVGDVGNAADTLVMTKGVTADMTTDYGSVGYEYQIAKHHVTNTQYTEFLNAVDPDGTNTLELYDDRMSQWFHPTSFEPGPALAGGIDFDDVASSGSKYSVKSGQENYPATWINWESSARFVNWLHNGQAQEVDSTDGGVYDMSLLTEPFVTPVVIPPRQEGATYFLPSEDEFYKAAYYDPTKNAGAGGYWQYGVQSDSPPVSEGPTGGATSANYATAAGAAGVNGDLYWQNGGGLYDDQLDHLTDVGSYSNATSYYGLYDVDGLLYQWTEDGRKETAGFEFPVYRGGSWFHSVERNGAAFRALYSWAAADSYAQYGFRIASALASVPGDFDGDGDVDGHDFLEWQRTDGTPAGLADWQGAYGTASLAVITTVPEPSSMMFLVALVASSVFYRLPLGQII